MRMRRGGCFALSSTPETLITAGGIEEIRKTVTSSSGLLRPPPPASSCLPYAFSASFLPLQPLLSSSNKTTIPKVEEAEEMEEEEEVEQEEGGRRKREKETRAVIQRDRHCYAKK